MTDTGPVQDMFDLGGRRALVTGASRGIGRAIAVAFAERGARVLAVARSEEGLRETASLAPAGQVEVHATDLRDEAAIERSVGARRRAARRHRHPRQQRRRRP